MVCRRLGSHRRGEDTLPLEVGQLGGKSAYRPLGAPLALGLPKRLYLPMTDKQAVIDALQRLPEDASLEEITEELRIMAPIRRGRADIAAGRTKTQEEAEHLLESWATRWTSR